MKFYLSAFPENKPFRKSCKKAGFGVITLSYLTFLVRAMNPKIFYKYKLYTTTSMLQICDVANKFKTLKSIGSVFFSILKETTLLKIP